MHLLGLVSPEERRLLIEAAQPWIANLLARGDYIRWVAEWESAVIAGGGIRGER